MIKEADKSEKQEIYALWKQSYPSQNEDYLKFYFDQIFDDGRCILIKQDNLVISSLQMNTHTIRLADKQLKAGYILGVSTLPEFRKRGYMRKLMESAMDEAGHNYLVSLIRVSNPKICERFGFEIIYNRKAYTVPREYLNKVSSANTSYLADAEELLQTYQKFVQHFDGYYMRDKNYYSILLNELKLHQKEMVVFRDKQQMVSGYMIYQKKKQEIVIEEAIYLESMALMRMMKKAIGFEKEITILVSSGERLEKIFPLVIPKQQAYLMARINHLPLFNKLYNTHVKTTKEAFDELKKPLWCHAYY